MVEFQPLFYGKYGLYITAEEFSPRRTDEHLWILKQKKNMYKIFSGFVQYGLLMTGLLWKGVEIHVNTTH